jgi:hypothetical protein
MFFRGKAIARSEGMRRTCFLQEGVLGMHLFVVWRKFAAALSIGDVMKVARD